MEHKTDLQIPTPISAVQAQGATLATGLGTLLPRPGAVIKFSLLTTSNDFQGPDKLDKSFKNRIRENNNTQSTKVTQVRYKNPTG
jgi:hypothetical protein